MARSPFSAPRTPNLFTAAKKLNPGLESLTAATKNLKKEFRILAAQAMNELSEDTVAEVRKESRSLPPLDQFVGGRKRATEFNLKPLVVDFDHRKEAVVFALTGLAKGAGIPIDSGEYSESFKLFVDGKEATPGQIRYGSKVEIINVTPYARMLEVGFNEKGQPFVQKVKPHIVERVMARELQNTYRSSMRTRFTFSTIPEPYILQTDFHTGRGGRRRPPRDRRKGMPINYPAVSLEI